VFVARHADPYYSPVSKVTKADEVDSTAFERMTKTIPVLIYTDGACLGNPGPGGYAAVLLSGTHRQEISGGFRRTTNNRMEIMAAIVGLESLKRRCAVTLYTDSKYVQQSSDLGWAKRWRAKAWKYKDGQRPNWDLWDRLLSVCAQHEVKFLWVRGHVGHLENERCDVLAVAAAKQTALPPDTLFEKPASMTASPELPSSTDLKQPGRPA
jgi:ribonuclease HI